MKLDAEVCYGALRTRDPRFDGMFFVGVATTGIYCRPICPARTPGRDRCAFFGCAAEAERAGYRACFRCRPEVAPGGASVDSVARLVREAVDRIDAGYLNDHSLADLAAGLGVSSRHLRRALGTELGVSPVELAQTRRLALAKQLVQDTDLRLVDIAFAAGFASVRRFNDLFRQRFGRPPSTLRRRHGAEDGDADCVTLRLDYRPPMAWQALLGFLGNRAIPGVESIDGGEYRRSVVCGEQVGWIAVRPDPDRAALRARVSLTLVPKLVDVRTRIRRLFDLDAHPQIIAEHLHLDPLLRPLVARRPGLRVPGAFDGFELAVRAVLGQQISVRAATTLSGRFAARFGAPSGIAALPQLFPRPERVAAAEEADVAAIGLPATRARTLIELARAVVEQRVDLSAGADPERAIAGLVALPGIGPWTAHYVAMRSLRWPNALPAGDLVLRRALGVTTSRAVEERARRWQPWRAYAVLHLWHSESEGE